MMIFVKSNLQHSGKNTKKATIITIIMSTLIRQPMDGEDEYFRQNRVD